MGRFLPSRGHERLLLVYDANSLPISFDVCWVLAWAETRARKLGHRHFDAVIVSPATSFVHAKPPGDPDYVSRDDLMWRVHQILVPLVSMYGAVDTLTVASHESWPSMSHELTRGAQLLIPPRLQDVYREVLADEACLAGFSAPGGAHESLATMLPAHEGRPIVSITIRESKGGTVRNSRLDQWNKFGDRLMVAGFCPVFVPDTDRWFADTKFSGHVLPAAALSMELRVALYETSALNMFVNSGPAAICYLSPKLPYLMFKILAAGERLSSREVVADLGFVIGENPPFAGGRQRWVWDDDSFDTLCREFDALSLAGKAA